MASVAEFNRDYYDRRIDVKMTPDGNIRVTITKDNTDDSLEDLVKKIFEKVGM